MDNDIEVLYDERAFGAALHDRDGGWVLELLEGASAQSVVEEVLYVRSRVAGAIPGGHEALEDPEKVAQYFQLRMEAAGYTAERVTPDRECVATWSLASHS